MHEETTRFSSTVGFAWPVTHMIDQSQLTPLSLLTESLKFGNG